jgi:peptide deformylase
VAERPIVIYGDPVLREVSHPVEEINQEVKDLVSQMVDTLRRAKGLGLAASQVGVPLRLFILDLSAIDIDETLRVFINPEIVATDGECDMEEGCLSFPEMYLRITRPERVTVRATDLDGNRFEMTVDGVTARAIQHEYDHTQGTLFIDHLSPLARMMLKGRLRKLAAAS